MEHNIKIVLPSLDDKKIEAVLDLLVDLGVINSDDLQHVEKDDLTSAGILKTIEARKLIKFWKNKVQKPAAPQPSTSYGSTEYASN